MEREQGPFLEKTASELSPEELVGVRKKIHILREREFKAEGTACVEGKKEWLYQGRQVIENGCSIEVCCGDWREE